MSSALYDVLKEHWKRFLKFLEALHLSCVDRLKGRFIEGSDMHDKAQCPHSL